MICSTFADACYADAERRFKAALVVDIPARGMVATMAFGTSSSRPVMPTGTPNGRNSDALWLAAAGVAVHLEAAISLPTLNGTWRDSTGASTTFVLIPGAGNGGRPRLLTASGIPPGSITSIQLANGAVGPSAVASNAITGANILDGGLTNADHADGPKASSSVEQPEVIDLPQGTYVIAREKQLTAPYSAGLVERAA